MQIVLSKTIKQMIIERSNDYSRLEESYTLNTGHALITNPFGFPPRRNKPTISTTVVIPTWNTRESLLACLASIEQSSFNLNYQNQLQVIVVDDGSTDGTWETIKKLRLSLNITFIRQNHYSVSQARNTGISVAEGDIIISCDADMVLSYYTIEQFITRHQQLSNVLLVGFRNEVYKNNPIIDAMSSTPFLKTIV